MTTPGSAATTHRLPPSSRRPDDGERVGAPVAGVPVRLATPPPSPSILIEPQCVMGATTGQGGSTQPRLPRSSADSAFRLIRAPGLGVSTVGTAAPPQPPQVSAPVKLDTCHRPKTEHLAAMVSEPHASRREGARCTACRTSLEGSVGAYAGESGGALARRAGSAGEFASSEPHEAPTGVTTPAMWGVTDARVHGTSAQPLGPISRSSTGYFEDGHRLRRPHRAVARGAAAGGTRPNGPRDRRNPLHQQAHRGSTRQQHPDQARSPLSGRSNGLRVPARPAVTTWTVADFGHGPRR